MSLPWALEELLPHGQPMILIDEVNEDPQLGFHSVVRIAEDSPFFEPGRGVPSYVGIEYVAQTVAARVGLQSLRTGGGVQVGYLLGARSYESTVPYFVLGSRLVVRVSSRFESSRLAQFEGSIDTADGQRIVSTSLNVYSTEMEGAADGGA